MLTLLGDSIFDNKPYVADHEGLMEIFKIQDIPVQFLAFDGAVINDMERQISQINIESVTGIALSVIGNDILNLFHANNLFSLFLQSNPLGDAEFQRNMDVAVREITQNLIDTIHCLLKLQKPLLVFLPYNTLLEQEIPGINHIITQGKTLMLDMLTMEFMNELNDINHPVGLTIVDLEDCFQEKHYANPIEPNHLGSKLIFKIIHQHFFH